MNIEKTQIELIAEIKQKVRQARYEALWLMAQFYNEYHQAENLQPLVGEISWTKNIVVLNKCNNSLERKLYTLRTRLTKISYQSNKF